MRHDECHGWGRAVACGPSLRKLSGVHEDFWNRFAGRAVVVIRRRGVSGADPTPEESEPT
jgi:hypothetical protein